MADYYSILKKTISGLAHNSQGTRTVVYGKARSAINRQLRAMEPTPSEELIARQMQLVEEAIEKLDAEFAVAGVTARENAVPANTQPAAAPPASNQPAISQPTYAQPTSVHSAGIPSVGAQPAAAITQPTVQQTNPVPAAPNNPVNKAGIPVDGGIGHFGASSQTNVPPENPTASQAPTPQVFSVNEPALADPRGMDYSETILATQPDTQARQMAGDGSKQRKSSFLSLLLPIVLALAVVGGGLYALWINKDTLIAAILGEEVSPAVQSQQNKKNNDILVKTETGTETESEPEVVVEKNVVKDQTEERNIRVVGEDDKPKTAAKLTPEGATVLVDPVKLPEETVAEKLQTNPVEKIETENTLPSNTQPEDTAPQVVEVGEDGQPKAIEETVTDKPVTKIDEAAPKSTEQKFEQTPAVAQKAFLYEEGTAGTSASRDNAAIVWSLGQETIEGNIQEAVINGQLDVPGRNLGMSLTIKRNRDESLPASHIIELVFRLPSDFSGGNISDVSRFVMKPSEQGRGEGLIAVPAKISDGNFLIALNNLEQALATNNKLLLESSWIDVPLGYTTGRRALVTLEKGALGDKVFRDAFADWAKR